MILNRLIRLILLLILSFIVECALASPPHRYVPPPLHLPSDTTGISVLVRRGDTLCSLGMRYRVTVKSLRELNELKSDVIYPGQRLLIPTNK